MPKSENQKRKLLLLLELLRRESDEEHPLSLSQIRQALADQGVNAERKSLYDDMETLRTLGYDVLSVRDTTTRYYLGERNFQIAELKLLVDAVQGSRFITRNKSDELIGKLAKDCSVYQAGALRRQVHVANRVKTMNESIYYSVDSIHTAIAECVQIRFQYFEWDRNKNKVLRHNGAFYTVSPWALTWDDENYYLIAYDSAAAAIRHYRVDKMLRITRTELPREGEDAFKDFDLGTYSRAVFGMFGGTPEPVTLRCDNSLAGVMIDRFGADTFFEPDGENAFRIHVSVSVSPVFLSWVIGFGARVQILSPDSVREQVRALAEETLEQYS